MVVRPPFYTEIPSQQQRTPQPNRTNGACFLTMLVTHFRRSSDSPFATNLFATTGKFCSTLRRETSFSFRKRRT